MSVLVPNQNRSSPFLPWDGITRVRNGRNTPSSPFNGNVISNGCPVAMEAFQRSITLGSSSGSCTTCQPQPSICSGVVPVYLVPAAIVPKDPSVWSRDPCQLRNRIGHLTETRFALGQLRAQFSRLAFRPMPTLDRVNNNGAGNRERAEVEQTDIGESVSPLHPDRRQQKRNNCRSNSSPRSTPETGHDHCREKWHERYVRADQLINTASGRDCPRGRINSDDAIGLLSKLAI